MQTAIGQSETIHRIQPVNAIVATLPSDSAQATTRLQAGGRGCLTGFNPAEVGSSADRTGSTGLAHLCDTADLHMQYQSGRDTFGFFLLKCAFRTHADLLQQYTEFPSLVVVDRGSKMRK